MPDTPQMAGADLARMALANARAAAGSRPAPGPAKPKRKRALRPGDGRDPVTFADAITGLGTNLPLEAGIGGGTVIDQWDTLCPHLVGRVQPITYDETRGRLDLRPGSHAYAAQLRLTAGQLAKQINDKIGKPIVRTIRVLPVGTLNTPDPGDATYTRVEPAGPVKTRETAHPGYRACLEAALAHKPAKEPTNPYTLEAMAAQEEALRRKRQSESEHREAYWAQADAEAAAGPKPGSVEASRRAALAYKRSQTASGGEPRRAFDVA